MESPEPAADSGTTVYLVAAVRLYRDGLALALRQAGGPQLAGAAAELYELETALAAARRPVLLLDVAAVAGPEALGPLLEAFPRVRVLMLGLSDVTAEILDWLEAGACGFVTRQRSVLDLVAAIEDVVRDELSCPPQLAGALMHRVAALAARRRHEWVGDLLSPREIEVVTLIGRGMSNKQIAAQLFITLATVKNHVHNILDKLNVTARGEAVAYLRTRHRLEPVPPQRPWMASRSATGDNSPVGVQT
ncbi:response regulator transcription factor [Actinoplanes sp. NEAU-A12]|uniref:Response regulator transcription factor n=1 Tax=Actinoplanes sandaracinus TaxID=3045177 RepID=A0ABT6WWL0_9ACTN|nr:response regulator transcription factor [Actinoplanes sandaracinus]MDI6104110.1 response regulator transcription factor [Actinoplanes sandaracinus]